MAEYYLTVLTKEQLEKIEEDVPNSKITGKISRHMIHYWDDISEDIDSSFIQFFFHSFCEDKGDKDV